jgi:hypothetical protein
MVGGFYRIPLPQSRVSSYFDAPPEAAFYPYFFSTKGTAEVLEVESSNESLGMRRMVVYLPPGVHVQ